MPSTNQPTTAAAPPATPAPAAKSRSRKPSTKSSHIIKLKIPGDALRKFSPPSTKPEAITKSSSSSTENTIANAATPPTEVKAEGTPLPSSAPNSMPPPTEAIKKKPAAPRGQKRNSGALGDSTPKPRGKPGPKKKPRLEDGTIDHTSTPPTTTHRAPTGHSKLGPKANQGAINAGLRALDRTGKPCRKWQRGSFKLKSFTGVVWEIPRWRAPPKMTSMPEMESSITTTSGSGVGSGKENLKEVATGSSVLESDKSNSAGDVDLGSLVSSPAPQVVAA